MAKVIAKKSRVPKSRAKAKADGKSVTYVRPTGLSAEQRRRYESLRKWLNERLEVAEKMSPAERAKDNAEWEAFKTSINAERKRVGARLLYVD
jgi:hypothetical protein